MDRVINNMMSLEGSEHARPYSGMDGSVLCLCFGLELRVLSIMSDMSLRCQVDCGRTLIIWHMRLL